MEVQNNLGLVIAQLQNSMHMWNLTMPTPYFRYVDLLHEVQVFFSSWKTLCRRYEITVVKLVFLTPY
jgi:spore germination protein YaaH